MKNPFFSTPITITKLEAAQRQLRTAIDLWFADGDPVAILTLAYASHEIIHRLYRKQGLRDLLYDTLSVKDESRKEFAKFLGEAPNFFKHAQRENAKETIKFAPTMADMFLVMSIVGLVRMNETLSESERIFNLWFAIHYPQRGLAKALAKKGIPINKAREALAALSKKEFRETLAGHA